MPEVLSIQIAARELSLTNNSKAGLCLDMDAVESCPGRTEKCSGAKINADGKPSKTIKKCYATHPPYGWQQERYKRNRNLIARCIAELGIISTAQAIMVALDLHELGHVPKIRLHGSGDIWSRQYCQVLIELAKLMPHKRFWLYTRSFIVPTLLPSIIELAKLPNVDVNLSADEDNYRECTEVFLSNPVFNAIACMQDETPTWIWSVLAQGVTPKQLILFPEHIPNKHVPALRGAGQVCPELMGAFQNKPIPCLSCKNLCTKEGGD